MKNLRQYSIFNLTHESLTSDVSEVGNVLEKHQEQDILANVDLITKVVTSSIREVENFWPVKDAIIDLPHKLIDLRYIRGRNCFGLTLAPKLAHKFRPHKKKFLPQIYVRSKLSGQ